MRERPRANVAQRPVVTAFDLDAYDLWYFDRLARVDPTLAKIVERRPEARARALDAFAALYKPAPALRAGASPELRAFGAALLSSPELARLRARTRLDEIAALAALRHLLGSLDESARPGQRSGGVALLAASDRIAALAREATDGRKASLVATATHAEQELRAAREEIDPAALTRPAIDKALHQIVDAYEAAIADVDALDRRAGLAGRLPARGVTPPPPFRFRKRPKELREPPSAYRDHAGEERRERDVLVARMLHLRHAFRGAQAALESERSDVESAALTGALRAGLRGIEEPVAIVQGVLALFGQALGWDRSRGAGHRLPFDQLRSLADMIRGHPDVRRIADLAGRWIEAADRAPRKRGPRGRDEVVGIDRGGSMHDVLAGELLGLRHPVLRRLTLARLVERTLLSRKLEGDDHLARGPVICLVDTSGSMHGARELFAKALALALALRALRRRRPFYLLTFGSRGEIVEAAMPRHVDPWARLQTVLEMGFGGGTDFDGPLCRVAALATAREWRQADALFITDGDCPVDGATRETLDAARKSTDLHLIEVNVGGGRGLASVADERFDVEPKLLSAPVDSVAASVGQRC